MKRLLTISEPAATTRRYPQYAPGGTPPSFGRPKKLSAEQHALELRLLREGKSVGEVAETFRGPPHDDLSAGGNRSLAQV